MSNAVDGDVLLLDLPADANFLAVLRTATAGLATRLGFGLDAIEDMRVAVDEAAGLMLTAANDPAATLRCRFDVTAENLVISIGASDIGPLPQRRSYDWRVLDALAGSVSTDYRDGVTTVRLSQARPEVIELCRAQTHETSGYAGPTTHGMSGEETEKERCVRR